MESFTAMSEDAIQAAVDAQHNAFFGPDGEHYRLELNPADFEALMWALYVTHRADESETMATVNGESMTDWSASFASGIADTLGVEMV